MTSARKRFASGVLLASFFLLISASDAHAIPAFARKYGLRCSACHEAWPMLNYFGQKFKDNGYQLMNDRDSPVWQNNAYWPVTMRITPSWHRESTDKVAIDTAGGPLTGQQQITAHGFDVGGLDMLSGGTLDKNISFLFVLSSDENASFHFESVNARLDNLFGSPWLNVKMGKFELDNIVSEKRGLTLSADGGGFQIYHFVPVGDNNFLGQIGDNQFGLEWMGHSANDRTRLSAALLSSTDGNVDLPGSNSYTGFFAGSQAFDAGKLGTQRVGFYAMIGQAPTNSLTADGVPIAGGGFGNKTFSREGFNGIFYLGKLDFQVVTQHGSDNAFFATSTAAPGALPAGARSSVWNGGFVETHYVYSPQLIFIQRSEWIRMSQQAIPGTPSNLGNIDNYVIGYRYMPFMTSRAGFAWHNEYSWIRQRGTAPDGTDLTSSSLMLGFDFDF
ncbi:MAG: hypothetical protein ACRD3H_08450 [Terriglobales bacterium]